MIHETGLFSTFDKIMLGFSPTVQKCWGFLHLGFSPLDFSPGFMTFRLKVLARTSSRFGGILASFSHLSWLNLAETIKRHTYIPRPFN